MACKREENRSASGAKLRMVSPRAVAGFVDVVQVATMARRTAVLLVAVSGALGLYGCGGGDNGNGGGNGNGEPKGNGNGEPKVGACVDRIGASAEGELPKVVDCGSSQAVGVLERAAAGGRCTGEGLEFHHITSEGTRKDFCIVRK